MSLRPLYHLPEATTSAGRSLALRVLMVAVGGAVVALWAATQYVAYQAGYHASLGTPLVDIADTQLPAFLALGSLGGALAAALLRRPRLIAPLLGSAALLAGAALGPVYSPLQFLVWNRAYGSLPGLSGLFATARAIALYGVGASGTTAFLLLALRLNDLGRKPDVFGSARWARTEDLRRANLLGPAIRSSIAETDGGIFLGLWPEGRRRYILRSLKTEHLLVTAPTRAGKGVGLVIPNLLTWPASVVVHDMKGENYELTAAYRELELGTRCVRWDVTSSGGAAFNPLLEVRGQPHDVRDAQNIADILVDPSGVVRERTHWEKTAHALLTGVILHVVHAEERKTLERCVELLSPGSLADSVDASLRRMVQTPHLGHSAHPTVASYLKAVLDKEKEERSGVISTALTCLDIYRDPLVAANTSRSDFRLRDLMHGDVPLSLYITVPPSDISRTRPVTRLLLNQLLRRVTEELPSQNDPFRHRLLLMMDEFPQLGRLPVFQDALAFMAGYGIQAILVAQSLSQLYEAYGVNESITDNCHCFVALTPANRKTAEALSAHAGQLTVHLQHVSRRGGSGLGSSTTSPAEHARKLLTPDELLRFPLDQQLLFAYGAPPARALRAKYYEDPELSRRSAVSRPLPL